MQITDQNPADGLIGIIPVRPYFIAFRLPAWTRYRPEEVTGPRLTEL